LCRFYTPTHTALPFIKALYSFYFSFIFLKGLKVEYEGPPVQGYYVQNAAQTMQIQVPQGMKAGQMMQFSVAGSMHQVQIPAGTACGQIITVQVSAQQQQQQQQATHGEWRYQLMNDVSIIPKIAPDTSSAAQPQARKLNEGEVFVVAERRQGADQTYLKLQTGGWAFTHHPSTGREICSLQQSASSSSSPPTAPPIAATQMMRGSLQVKVKGSMFGDSWVGADSNYNPATREFSSTDSKGKQQRVADCWVVDVLNREGKKQHRFDVVSYTQGTLVALAAAGGAEKQRWLAVMEAGTLAVAVAAVLC
jgi:hypothetical protein